LTLEKVFLPLTDRLDQMYVPKGFTDLEDYREFRALLVNVVKQEITFEAYNEVRSGRRKNICILSPQGCEITVIYLQNIQYSNTISATVYYGGREKELYLNPEHFDGSLKSWKL